MRELDDTNLLSVDRIFDDDGLAAQLEARRRKRRRAYPAWLLFGSHHLYLGRPVVQLLFWATLGGLLVWWIIDLFRLPGMVERQNRRVMRDLLKSRQLVLDRYLAERALWPAPPGPGLVAPALHAELFASEEADSAIGRRSARFGIRTGPGMVLAGAFATILCVHLFAPPDRYPRASVEPAFRTLRSANVREAPSLNGRISGKVGKDVLLRGEVEQVATSGSSQWLRITSGAHFNRYVALQNLEKR